MPPYKELLETISSPFFKSVSKQTLSADWPDAVARAALPPSRAATLSSRIATVGLLILLYTLPNV